MRCPICHPDDPKGPTGELLAWAKKVGRQEVITELRDKGVAIPREMTACQP